MKKLLLIFLIALLFFSCNSQAYLNKDSYYKKIINMNNKKFFYITYTWKDKKFKEAIDIVKNYINISNNKINYEMYSGNYPARKECQLGLLTKNFSISKN